MDTSGLMDGEGMGAEDEVNTSDWTRDRFIIAALLLIGDGMAAEELAERLQPITGDPHSARVKLEHMAQLGLVRAVDRGEGITYAPTAVGRSYTLALLQGQSEILRELEALETMRQEVLAAIAHEFRTPLTAVRTAVGLLQDPALPHQSQQERRLLEAIAQSAEVMQRLVTDFLDLARFRAGTMTLDVRRFEANKLAGDAVDTMSALFEARKQGVVVSRGKTPIRVHGDRRRLLQALLNLLSNANKFAPEGSTIDVTVESEGDDVLWTVTDNGPGIAEEIRDRLFERFFTMSRSDSGQTPGTGLGLPLVLATAHAHGGTVQVASAPGQGASFTLRIPANTDRQAEER